jgi:general secretion pathway protein N
MSKRLVAIAIAAYLLFLIIRLPANLLLPLVSTQVTDLKLNGVEGTLWRGRASSVFYDNIYAGELEWEARPLRLLLGQWSAAVQLDGPINARADIGYALTGQINVSNATIDGNLSAVSRYLPQTSVMALQGELSGLIESLVVQQGSLLEIEGTFTLGNLAAGDLSLGDFNAEAATSDDDTKRLVFQSVGREGLDAEGELSLDQQDKITLDLLVRNPGQLGDLSGLFRKFSSEEPDGNRLQWSGDLALLKRFL